MADPRSSPESRVIKLSQYQVQPKSIVGAYIAVDGEGFVGEARVEAIKLVKVTSRAQGHQENPTHLKIIESQRSPDDVAAVPTMEESPDHIPLTWSDKGRALALNFAQLFAAKQIVIPEGTRMMIELYEENDADFGRCVGMKLKSAAFVPKKRGAPRRKKSAAPPAQAPEQSPPQTPPTA